MAYEEGKMKKHMAEAKEKKRKVKLMRSLT